MNAERRKRIEAVLARIEEIEPMLTSIREEIEAIRDEEQDAFDGMPESFQNGERGEKAQAAIDTLESAASDLEALDLESITSSLNEAKE